MPRSGEEARERLRTAALELYGEKGYDQATTAQIAERAGVTERTFFRHFADKREVVFDEETLRDVLGSAMDRVPAGVPPMTAMLLSFRETEAHFLKHRPLSGLRHRIIMATPALQERALSKQASLVFGLAAALETRGLDSNRALLAAQIGMAACASALRAWSRPGAGRFTDHLDAAFAEVRTLASPLPT